MDSLGLHGIQGYRVQVECDLSGGLPAFDLVGLPDAAVKEAKERVRSAIRNAGYSFPVSRITVNLSPPTRKRRGTVYDLPILLGILKASGPWRPTWRAAPLWGRWASPAGAPRSGGCCPWPWRPGRRAFSGSSCRRTRQRRPPWRRNSGLSVDNVAQLMAHLTGREAIPPAQPWTPGGSRSPSPTLPT